MMSTIDANDRNAKFGNDLNMYLMFHPLDRHIQADLGDSVFRRLVEDFHFAAPGLDWIEVE